MPVGWGVVGAVVPAAAALPHFRRILFNTTHLHNQRQHAILPEHWPCGDLGEVDNVLPVREKLPVWELRKRYSGVEFGMRMDAYRGSPCVHSDDEEDLRWG
jgi:hypothetical protein